jgi:hypothetical protein
MHRGFGPRVACGPFLFLRRGSNVFPPGARVQQELELGIPFDVFVAGVGQRFSPVRQVVPGIAVTATMARGAPVTLVWGSARKR